MTQSKERTNILGGFNNGILNVLEYEGDTHPSYLLAGPSNGHSGTKNDSGKPDLSLIPYCAEVALAEALMVGERKYGRFNYTRGMSANRLIASLKRHVGRWADGEERCLEDGQPHLGSVMAIAAMLLDLQRLGRLKDDRFFNSEEAKNVP